MTSKLDDFRHRLATLLIDLNRDGVDDGEAMFYLGGTAIRLCDLAGKPSWSALKPVLTKADYNRLFAMIDKEGKQLLGEGKTKPAYALQALAMSLAASTQNEDATIREGEKLLDAVIDRTVANFRERAQPHLNKAN